MVPFNDNLHTEDTRYFCNTNDGQSWAVALQMGVWPIRWVADGRDLPAGRLRHSASRCDPLSSVWKPVTVYCLLFSDLTAGVSQLVAIPSPFAWVLPLALESVFGGGAGKA